MPLNTIPFPKDTNGIYYYDNKDASNFLTMPTETYIRSASNLFVPVSAANPLPVIEAALALLIGEVQASPTAYTVLSRLKTIGDKDFATQTTLAAILANQVLASKVGIRVNDTITIGTGAVHSIGDVVSTDAGKILQFNMSSIISAGGSGKILASLVTLDQSSVFVNNIGYTLELFTISPTVQATNAIFDLADADLAGYLAPLTIDTLVDKGTNCCSYNEHNIPFKLATGDTKLYGKLVANGGETTISGAILNINLDVIAQ